MDRRLARAPIGVLELTPEGTVTEINDRAGELLRTDSSAVGRSIESVFPAAVDASVPSAVETPPTDEPVVVEEYYPELDRWLEVSIVGLDTDSETERGRDVDSVVLYVTDESDRHDRARQRTRLRDDLDRLTVITELISDIFGELVDASSRAEIAETICRRLGETELYEFAWVGERELDGDGITTHAAAGTTGRTFEAIEAALAAGDPVPETEAVEAGAPTVVEPIGEADRVPQAVRRAAFADGLQSLLAVPLVHGTSVYGVVGLYTTDQTAFSPRERASFETVGEVAGFAVNATRHRNLLLSDTVVELRLGLTDRADPVVAAAADHELTGSLQGLVPQGAQVLCYLTVEGTAPDVVGDTLAAHEQTDGVRVIEADSDGGSLEVTLDDTTVLGRLIDRGATVSAGEFDRTGAEIVTDLPPDEDIRRLVDSVTRGYDATVLAKRERDREATTTRELRETLGEQLTDRQQAALKTAFLAEYFESPRGSTAEEVAGALDITGPTLLYHLRAAQRKLLAEVFDSVTPESRPDE